MSTDFGGGVTVERSASVLLFTDTETPSSLTLAQMFSGSGADVFGPSVSNVGFLSAFGSTDGQTLVTSSIKVSPITFFGTEYRATLQPSGSREVEKIAVAGETLLLSASTQTIMIMGDGDHFFFSAPGNSANWAVRNGLFSINSRNEVGAVVVPVGDDVTFFVSGGLVSGSAVRNIAVFSGGVRVSGALSIGSGFASLKQAGNSLKFFDEEINEGITLTQLAIGSFTLLTERTGAYTADGNERLPWNASGGGFTLTAPVTSVSGVQWALFENASDATSITIDGNGAQIENPAGGFASSFAVAVADISLVYLWNGTRWKII